MKSLSSVPLGYMVEATGVRRADGSIEIARIDAKPNGQQMFESDVKQATEDTLLGLADHLPAEAAEALLELATGGQLRVTQPAPEGGAFEHPDAQRRFRIVTNVEELERELSLELVSEELEEEIDTLGGLVFSIAGRIPARGELVRHPSGVEFEVLEADPRRIKKLRIHLPPPEAEADASEPENQKPE